MLSLVVASAVAVGAPVKLAILNPEAVNVAPETAAFFVDHLGQQLQAAGVAVVTTRQMQVLLGAEKGCKAGDLACLTELASALGTDGVVLFDVARFGATIRTNVTVISARDASTLATCADRSPDDEHVADALSACARKVSAELRPQTGSAVPARLRVLGWVPFGVGAAAAITGGAVFSVGAGSWAQLTAPRTTR